MTTPNATVAPPAVTAARRYSEHMHTLLDRQTREYILGLAILEAEAGGYARPKEGDAARTLIAEAIGRRYKADQDAYEAAVRRGRVALAQRDAEKAERAQHTTKMVEAVARPSA